MSRSNLQVITDALRLVGIIRAIQTPNNEDSQDALLRLNDMMSAWEREKGIQLGYYPQTSLSANIPVDDEYFQVITENLARRLSLHWGVGLDPLVANSAEDGYHALLSEFAAPTAAKLDFVPGSRRSNYDIDTDTQ